MYTVISIFSRRQGYDETTPLAVPTPRNLHVVSPTILIPEVKKGLVCVDFAIRGTIKSHEKDSLIPIAYFFDDDTCE